MSDESLESQEPYRYKIPEEVQIEIDLINESEFWTEEYLEERFRDDIAFGAQIWGGLLDILGLEWEKKPDAKLRQEFDERTEPLLIKGVSASEQAKKLLELREWASGTFGILLSKLTAREILTRAYITEAEAMKAVGFDPEKSLPFSASIELNRENPLVKEVLHEIEQEQVRQGGEILEKLMQETPSLKKAAKDFTGGSQPPHDKIE